MTNLLLKTKTELFNGSAREERERERERLRTENSEKLQGSIFLPSFQFKVHPN